MVKDKVEVRYILPSCEDNRLEKLPVKKEEIIYLEEVIAILQKEKDGISEPFCELLKNI